MYREKEIVRNLHGLDGEALRLPGGSTDIAVLQIDIHIIVRSIDRYRYRQIDRCIYIEKDCEKPSRPGWLGAMLLRQETHQLYRYQNDIHITVRSIDRYRDRQIDIDAQRERDCDTSLRPGWQGVTPLLYEIHPSYRYRSTIDRLIDIDIDGQRYMCVQRERERGRPSRPGWQGATHLRWETHPSYRCRSAIE